MEEYFTLEFRNLPFHLKNNVFLELWDRPVGNELSKYVTEKFVRMDRERRRKVILKVRQGCYVRGKF